jgi:hypothetical protein
VEDFSLWLQSIISQLAAHGITIDDEEAVSKYLRVVPPKYTQIALSIETMLDMSTLTIVDLTRRLRAVDNHIGAIAAAYNGKLLLTEEWVARMKEKQSREGSSSRGGDGKRRGKAPEKKKKELDPNACWRCGKTGHCAKECKNPKEKKVEAHPAQVDDDEPTLLMAPFCALHDVDLEEVVAAAEQGKAP